MSYWLMSFGLGAIAVLQGGLNRQIAAKWGLSTAIFYNSFLLFAIVLLFISLAYFYPQAFPESFSLKLSSQAWRWWFVIPALCGLALITGIPALIPKLGAAGVFLCIVVGQLTFSILWDLNYEEIAIPIRRYVGVCLALLGLLISYVKF